MPPQQRVAQVQKKSMIPRVNTLAELCNTAATLYGDRAALGTRRNGQWTYLSFEELGKRVAQCRAGLAALGVGPGTMVSVASNNREEWAILAYATFGLRAALVPMYEAQPPKEWGYILKDSGAKVVCASGAAYAALNELKPQLPGLTHVIGFDLPEGHPQAFGQLLSQGEHSLGAGPDPDDMAACIYTSGTTGVPKGVRLSHRNLCANVNGVMQVFRLGGDSSLSFLPWAHAFGQTADLHSLLLAGTTISLNDEVSRLLDNLAELKPTILCAVPRIFNRVYDRVNQSMAERPAFIRSLFRSGIAASKKRRSGQSLSLSEKLSLALADRLIFRSVRGKLGGNLRFAISGSAALSREVAEFIDALGVNIYEGYGLTEAAPVVAVNSEGHVRLGSVGLPLPGVRIRIDQASQGEDGKGEIIVYGDNVMLGYHERPEETQERLTPDGGLRTGDLGHQDSDGYLFITGRIKEQYKLENGKYVVPSPLEEELKLSPYISNIVLYGDNRPFNVALVVPDQEALKRWADEQQQTLGDLNANSAVQALLKSELETRSASMKSFERPKSFAILKEDFTLENGFLTPSLKVRREKIVVHFREQLEALYRPTSRAPQVESSPKT